MPYRDSGPRLIGPHLALPLRMRRDGARLVHGPANALPLLNTGLPGYKIVPFKTMEKSLYDRFGRHLKMAKGMCRDVVVRPTYEGGKKTRPVYQKMKPRECLKRAQRIVKDQ